MSHDILTKRLISHDEARAALQRFVHSHFRDGREVARFGIPARPDYDDDLVLSAYIKQQEDQPETSESSNGGCEDCNRPYGYEHGFPDFVIPYDAWKRISTSGDDSGLLCPSCICQRLHDKGIRCEGAFTSGPIISVSESTMSALRRVENIELAIDGRDNRWSGIRELVKDNEP